MTQPQPLYDVALIGYGPVSEIMAIALARQGRKVAIFERWTQRYPLPRAVCIDHEMYRVLCALGMGKELPAVSHAGPMYRWFNAEWQELLAIDWASESISGGPQVNFVHQPTLEQMFDEAVCANPNVALNLGWEAVQATQTADEVALVVRQTDSGETRSVRARYLIGADGANSFVRRTIGATQEDRGFQADWLVVDVLPNEGVVLDIPEAAQWCNPERPTTIVPAGIKNGRYFRRWEFMRLPHERIEDLEHEDRAWQLLAPWVQPGQATIVRHKVYTFRSLLAQRWRQCRMLIAGDAAHVMPPFMGQGMCAGLRDDWNLAWKLGMVLDGRADERLLDTYEPERRPHVSDVIDLSMYLGKMICMPDPAQAAERDRAFLGGTATPPPPFPCLSDGLLRRDAQGAVTPPAGQLSPHGRVRDGAREGRFDEIVGLGFVLITRKAQALAQLLPRQRAWLDALGVHTACIAAPGASTSPGVLLDLDRKYLPFMAQMGIDAMLVRPDFYLYGGVASQADQPNGDDLGRLIDDLARDLDRHGVKLAGGAVEPAEALAAKGLGAAAPAMVAAKAAAPTAASAVTQAAAQLPAPRLASPAQAEVNLPVQAQAPTQAPAQAPAKPQPPAKPAKPSRRLAIQGLGSSLFLGLTGAAAAQPRTETDASGRGLYTRAHRCECGLVDTHSHYLPPVYAQALADAGLVTLDGGFPVPEWSEQKALEHMDRNGIDTSMLSVSSPTVSFLKDGLQRQRLAREVNEYAAALVRRQPQRFGAFATLPLPDVSAALNELGYALDVLQLDGVVLETNTHGVYLGDATLDPLFAELNRRKAVVFLHPTSPPCLEQLGLGRPAPLVEFPMDTARTVTDLIFAGTLTRYPDIRMIVPHAGGALTALAERIAAFSALPFLTEKPAGGAEEVRRVLASLYYDLASSASDAGIERLRRITSLTHVFFGSDFPFTPAPSIEANVQGFRTLTNLSRDEHENIARRNAEALFPRLKVKGWP